MPVHAQFFALFSSGYYHILKIQKYTHAFTESRGLPVKFQQIDLRNLGSNELGINSTISSFG